VFSEFAIDITERITLLIDDHTVIIDDNAVRSTKIACGLDFVNRIAELPVLNAEPIADVFRRISSVVPNDTSHVRAYNGSRADCLAIGLSRGPSCNLFKDRQSDALP
jgi:hypothetical protein